MSSHVENQDSVDLLPGELRWRLQSYARAILPDQSVAECLRHPVLLREPNGKPIMESVVDVKYDADRDHAHWGGLARCGNIHGCPMCASRISERRRKELADGVMRWRARGGSVLLVTFTLQHFKYMSLAASLRALGDALDSLKSGRWFQSLKAEFGWFGQVWSGEETYGDRAGWHPHRHMLVFLDHELSPAGRECFRDKLRSKWRVVLQKQGYTAFWGHGVDVQSDFDRIAQYVAKYGHEPVELKPGWSVVHEVTKSVAKVGKDDRHRTPFQILADSQGHPDSPDAALFREYYSVMKGKKQLVWSQGLKAALGIEELSDPEAAELPEGGQLVFSLTSTQWVSLLTLPGRCNDIRREVLWMIEQLHGDPHLCAAWLISTFGIYPIMPPGHTLPIDEGAALGTDRAPPS